MLGKVSLAAALAAALVAPSAAGAGMERFQWQNRPLLVFAPDPEHAAYRAQLDQANRYASGFAERDMVVIAVVAGAPVTVDGTPAKDLEAAVLRRRFEVPEDRFAAILVGKDGTEKLRRNAAIGADTLFQTIDAMPMRRREMREQDDR
jgi:hypothetical protein